MGLGDKGTEGIDEFKLQHMCNSICKDLQLPGIESPESKAPAAELRAEDDPDDMYGDDAAITNDGTKTKNPEGNLSVYHANSC